MDIHQQKIIILDFGSQYTQLIARRVREAGVYSEVYPWNTSAQAIQARQPRGIIFSGGPETVTAEHTPRVDDAIFSMGIPILGICYGMQTMAHQLGGGVALADKREFGHAIIDIVAKANLFAELTAGSDINQLDVWMSHGDHVSQLPSGFELLAATANAPIAAMGDVTRQFYGLQFHPEVTHTQYGQTIIERFVHDICGCKNLWTTANIIEDSIALLRQKVGDEHVILGLSGGVDSSVVAALLHQTIGDQLTCVFVDTGLLRLNEADQVMQTFAEHMGIHVIKIDAEHMFMQRLAGVTDPEKKRKIFGALFIEIFEAEAKKIKDAKWLAQGTIYPDVIESAGNQASHAKVIKSHHNVGGLPKDLNLKLLEPLRELFKDEVRQIGKQLGLPAAMLERHPFPGPGLGVRILGEIKKQYADLLRQADAIFIEELHKHDLYYKTSQAFAVFLPVKSVGVVGDARQYEYVIALRAVETIDFMTARWSHLPHDFLALVANRIVNEVAGISRVTYDITSKPPATIEWE